MRASGTYHQYWKHTFLGAYIQSHNLVSIEPWLPGPPVSLPAPLSLPQQLTPTVHSDKLKQYSQEQ